jgi:hypothetical protein
MRRIALLLGLVAAFTSGAWAQVNQRNPFLLASSSIDLAPATPSASASLPAAPTPNLSPARAEPQGVYGVFESYSYQGYVGFNFTRFYQVPGLAVNTAGVDGSIVYLYRDWLGADGEVSATFGSQSGQTASFIFVGAGPRLRMAGVGRFDFWAHALGGYAHYLPKTPYGGEGALAGEFGGGVDFNPHHGRFSYRLQADAVGTHFFGTYQTSPKVSVGLVYKF